ncbi:MAG: DUF3221 domain-containing protein [Patescibacteria group bacterium]
MKKTLIIIIGAVVLILAITTAFVFLRGGDEGDEGTDSLSDIKGFVFEITQDSILVAEDLSGPEPYDGDTERLEGNAITYQITEDTKVLSPSGEEISPEDIQLHDEVEVWSTGVAMESFPSQAEATKIEITGGTFQPEEPEEPETLSCDGDHASRMNVINSLENSWAEVESDIPERPSMGATSWHSPYHVQFIGNDTIMTAFEDGHSVMTAIIEFTCEEGEAKDFSIVDTVDNFPLDEDNWSDLKQSYGDRSRSLNTYTSIDVYVEGDMIEVDDWEEVEPNIFILDTGSGKKL